VPVSAESNNESLMTSIPRSSNDWNETVKLWHAVGPSGREIAGVFAAFPESRVLHILPRLVMVRRAVAARFYTDDLAKRPRVKRARLGNRNAHPIIAAWAKPSSNATSDEL
jgi:hypothetical protein